MTIMIPLNEMRELIQQTPARGRADIERLEDNAVILKATEPISATVRLDDFKLQGTEVSAQLNLNFLVRKGLEMFLRTREDLLTMVRLEEKRVFVRMPPRLLEFIEPRSIRITPAGVTVEGKLKKIPRQRPHTKP